MKRAAAADSATSSKLHPRKKMASSSCACDLPLMSAALRTSVFPLLSTRDAAALLSSCTSFRRDSELAALVLQTGPAREHSQHFGAKCERDWFDFTPARFNRGYDRAVADCSHTGYTGHASCDDTSTRLCSRPRATAQLVSLVAAIEQCVLPAQLPEQHIVAASEDLAFTVPVVISLWDHHPNRQSLQSGHEWTRDDVQLALNNARPGLGDAFMHQPVHASVIGLHWESIGVVPSACEGQRATVECSFCAKSAYIVESVRTLQYDYPEKLAALRASSAGQAYAYCNAVIQRFAGGSEQTEADSNNNDGADASDNDDSGSDGDYIVESLKPLVRILMSKTVRLVPPALQGCRYTSGPIQAAVHDYFGYPDACRTFAQPLKRFLLQHCQFTRRVRYEIQSDKPVWMWGTEVELLAGVTASGYLCGAFFALVSSL